MARIRPAKKLLHSYTIHGTSSVVRAGDCVLMRAYEARSPPYVAKVERIEAEDQSDVVKVHVRWYYRPEEILGGRRAFHGAKEVFSSEHFDIQNVDTIEGKCKVHAFTEYMKLPSVGADDYFYRFQYNPADGSFTPDRVAVYCICEMPYNPDDLMVECDGCKDWFHPSCLNITPEEAKKTEPFLCLACSSEAGDKLPRNSPLVSPPSTPMPQLKRRKK